ncbi:MAG: FkbM family methyltransferase [Verrucomicrobiota bacterium]
MSKEVNGKRFRVPLLGGMGAEMRHSYEPWMLKALSEVSEHTTGCFVDVGVNLGQTLLAVKSIRSDWEYVGFEPNPLCVFYVRRFIAANKIAGCTVYPFGIGEETGAVDLHVSSETGGEASIVSGFRPDEEYRERIKVPIMGKESLPGELMERSVGVVKVDVEGGELDVFRALGAVLEKERPYVFCEVLPVYDEGTERGRFRLQRQNEVLRIFGQLGYAIIRLHPDGNREKLETIEVHGELAWTNYMFVPEGKEGLFLG